MRSCTVQKSFPATAQSSEGRSCSFGQFLRYVCRPLSMFQSRGEKCGTRRDSSAKELFLHASPADVLSSKIAKTWKHSSPCTNLFFYCCCHCCTLIHGNFHRGLSHEVHVMNIVSQISVLQKLKKKKVAVQNNRFAADPLPSLWTMSVNCQCQFFSAS